MQQPISPEIINDVPNLCGYESRIAEVMAPRDPIFLAESGIDFNQVQSCFTIALHMHQPLIPARGGDLRTARVIGNLQYMMEHQNIGDNHNAPIFHWCYKRMSEFVPQLLREGKQPRVMLDYSGCLLHGLIQMGLRDVLEGLKSLTRDPACRRCVEWLGSAWGHP